MCTAVFFFFKQKTAYEMRISDWSSDVCSSDLKYRQKFRGGDYIVITPRQVGEECFGEIPNIPMATNIGRSLQALCWERSALHGNLVFVMTVEEYEHEQDRKSTRLNSSH